MDGLATFLQEHRDFLAVKRLLVRISSLTAIGALDSDVKCSVSLLDAAGESVITKECEGANVQGQCASTP